MTDIFSWHLDPELYEFELKTDKGKEIFRIIDGYSQWLLRHGADFDLTRELTKEFPTDFNYVTIIQHLMQSGRLGPERADQFGGELTNLDFLNPSIWTNEIPPDQLTDLVARLPLRTRSVATGGLKAATYTPHKNAKPEKMIIVGIIDDSCNFTQDCFRTKSGDSRVDFAWIQDGDAINKNSTVKFGSEWTNSQINQKIAEFGTDDDGLFAALQMVGKFNDIYRPSPLRFRASHGTHVADLAAGYDPQIKDKPDRRLITVQLPSLASQDTSGAALIGAVHSAVLHVFERALLMSRTHGFPIPVVLNFSFGFNIGPRNGLHVLERILAKAAQKYREDTAELVKGKSNPGAPAEIVLPAGNAHLAQTHAKGKNGKLNLGLRLQPDDRTSSYMETWVVEGTKNVSLDITAPGGDKSTLKFDLVKIENEIKAGILPESWVLGKPATPKSHGKIDANTVITRLSVDAPNIVPPGFLPGNYWRILLAFAPTSIKNSDRSTAVSGLWHINISSSGAAIGTIHSWIARDESLAAFKQRGRQAYFDDDCYEDTLFDHMGDIAVFDQTNCTVTRDGTISGIATNAPANARKNIIVGGYRWDTKGGAIYSAAGTDTENSPLFMSPTETSRVLPGVRAAGSKCGTTIVQNGSSVAAPQVVRFLADEIESITDLQERADFNAEKVLTSKIAAQPPRPLPAGIPELASNDVIREERVKHGLLPVHDDHTDQVERHVRNRI